MQVNGANEQNSENWSAGSLGDLPDSRYSSDRGETSIRTVSERHVERATKLWVKHSTLGVMNFKLTCY